MRKKPINSVILRNAQELSANPVQRTLKPGAVADSALSPKQEAFAQHYVEFGSLLDAYRSAYSVSTTNPHTARNNGYKVLNHPRVAARIRELRGALCERSLMSTGELIADLEAMVTADVNELMSIDYANCRRCHGTAHSYQWRDEAEHTVALAQYLDSQGSPRPLPEPDNSGGYGFDPHRAPHPDCPHCEGQGVQRVRIANTADVSPGARKLYRGVELYESGQVKRILLNDPMSARIELHRLRGMHVDRSVSVNVNANIPQLKDMSQEQALDFLESLRPTQ